MRLNYTLDVINSFLSGDSSVSQKDVQPSFGSLYLYSDLIVLRVGVSAFVPSLMDGTKSPQTACGDCV